MEIFFPTVFVFFQTISNTRIIILSLLILLFLTVVIAKKKLQVVIAKFHSTFTLTNLIGSMTFYYFWNHQKHSGSLMISGAAELNLLKFFLNWSEIWRRSLIPVRPVYTKLSKKFKQQLPTKLCARKQLSQMPRNCLNVFSLFYAIRS